MAQPFFSVVMPVYNVEAHLEKAVRSVLAQTYADFELILVDDCSPDKSGEIADRLAAEDARIRVIHKDKNGGLSLARNTGLEQVTGLYVQFMDSDDWVEDTLLEQVNGSLSKNPAHAVVFGLVEDYYDVCNLLIRSVPIRVSADMLLKSQKELRPKVIRLEQLTLYGYAWNKFYRVDYLRSIGLQFQVVTLIEDIQFNVRFFMDIESLNVLSCTPYHYNKRLDGSLTNKFVPEYFELSAARVQAVFDQYKCWNACDETVRGILGAIYVRYLFSALQRNCDARSGMSRQERRRWLVRLYDTSLFQELMPHANASSRLVKVMHRFLWKRHTTLSLMAGRLIYLIKHTSPMLFARAKQHR